MLSLQMSSRILRNLAPLIQRSNELSTTTISRKDHYQILVLGGGTGGASVSNRFCRKLGKGKVAIVEPADYHYYQPMWTMIGGGMKRFEQSQKPMEWVLPTKTATWYKDRCVKIDPKQQTALTASGKEISYDYLVIALGIQLRYDLIKGLPEAFETPGVCSNYHKDYVHKTLKALENFREGNAIFTFPNTPIKCAGAPQKIVYIADEYFRKHGKREKANIIYNTSLGVLFGIKKYADVLWKIVKQRGISVNMRHSLVEIRPDSREAVFDLLNDQAKPTGEKKIFKYEMIHVAPPCSSPEVLRNLPELTDATGFLNVNKDTMQHNKFANIFGIGDCTNAPTAKTAAAVSAQSKVLYENLSAVMEGKPLKFVYDGYTSCPLVTGYSKCVLAEFDYNGQPLETFPFNQGKELRLMFYMKKDMMPQLYWYGLVKGYWNGPGWIRKLLHFGMSK